MWRDKQGALRQVRQQAPRAYHDIGFWQAACGQLADLTVVSCCTQAYEKTDAMAGWVHIKSLAGFGRAPYCLYRQDILPERRWLVDLGIEKYEAVLRLVSDVALGAAWRRSVPAARAYKCRPACPQVELYPGTTELQKMRAYRIKCCVGAAVQLLNVLLQDVASCWGKSKALSNLPLPGKREHGGDGRAHARSPTSTDALPAARSPCAQR
jgi:hypothetical protein